MKFVLETFQFELFLCFNLPDLNEFLSIIKSRETCPALLQMLTFNIFYLLNLRSVSQTAHHLPVITPFSLHRFILDIFSAEIQLSDVFEGFLILRHHAFYRRVM